MDALDAVVDVCRAVFQSNSALACSGRWIKKKFKKVTKKFRGGTKRVNDNSGDQIDDGRVFTLTDQCRQDITIFDEYQQDVNLISSCSKSFTFFVMKIENFI